MKKDHDGCPMCDKDVLDYIGVQFLPAEKSVSRQQQPSQVASGHQSPPQSLVSSPPLAAAHPGFEHTGSETKQPGIQPYRPPQLLYDIAYHQARARKTVNVKGLIDILCEVPLPNFAPIKGLHPALVAPFLPPQVSLSAISLPFVL